MFVYLFVEFFCAGGVGLSKIGKPVVGAITCGAKQSVWLSGKLMNKSRDKRYELAVGYYKASKWRL